jgi:hypothetical protein
MVSHKFEIGSPIRVISTSDAPVSELHHGYLVETMPSPL